MDFLRGRKTSASGAWILGAGLLLAASGWNCGQLPEGDLDRQDATLRRLAPAGLKDKELGLVDLELVRTVAMNNAEALWGDVSADEAIPLFDLEDQPSGYMFNFRVDLPFPRAGEVLDTLEPTDPWGTREYRHITMSARYSQQPVDEYAQALSQEYVLGPETRELARKVLEGRKVWLDRIYDLGLSVKWFVYTDGAEHAFVRQVPSPQVYKARDFDDKVRYPRLEALQEAWEIYEPYAEEDGFVDDFYEDWHAQAEGQGLLGDAQDERLGSAGGKGSWTYNYLQHFDLVPFYDWHYGCTPTAAAMVLGYYDKIGILSGHDSYSRLIQKFRSAWDDVEKETDHHVPGLAGELAMHMNTDSDGMTRLGDISVGVEKAVTGRGYDSQVEGHGTVYKDATYKDNMLNEIQADRPCLLHSSDHSNTVVGYMRKRVGLRVKHKARVHNTYDDVVHTHGCKWFYKITSIHMRPPGEEDVGTIELLTPHGNTTYWNHPSGAVTLLPGNSYYIEWDTDFMNYGMVDIYLYGQGVAPSLLASVPNTHTFLWTLPDSMPNMDGMRIQVLAYSPGGHLIGADSSFGYFDIEGAEPDLVIDSIKLFGPPNPDPAGDVYDLQMVVKNVAQGNAGAFDVNVSVNVVPQVSVHPIPGLLSGQAVQFSRALTLVLGEKYDVLALADAYSVIGEVSESNNARTLSLGSDLELVYITNFPVNPVVGEEVQFAGLVRNIGNMTSPASTVWTSFSDQAGSTQVSIPMLDPGDTEPARIRRTFTSAGSYTLTMSADGSADAAELNEVNNTLHHTFSVSN